MNLRVNMRLRLLRKGPRFSIFSLDLSTGSEPVDCPAEELIADLPDADRKSLAQTLRRHAKHGQILNDRKSRGLGGGLLEFKTRGGARLFYFYDAAGRTIITNGFMKKSNKTPRTEIARARALRQQWESTHP